MSEPADLPPGTASTDGRLLRLADAGDAKPAWITLLTTEHYNLQTQRAATISETNGRASIFLGAVSAGLIALGFQGAQGGRSGATTAFQAVVLSALAFLGAVTFLRCLETSLDDWLAARRIDRLRAAYAQLVPELAGILRLAAGAEQSGAMLTARRQPFQMMLTVAGSMAVVTSILLGADVGVLVYGPTGRLWIALLTGTAAGLVAAVLAMRFQAARWRGALSPVGPTRPGDTTHT